jgi:hypothetical protein
MSEQLLGQQVGIIYWLWKEAIVQNASGNSYEALKTLGYVTVTLYDNGENNPDLNCINEALGLIQLGETQIHTAETRAREAQIIEYRNAEAGKLFMGCMGKVRKYMQKVGYYTMMNEKWGFFDPSKGKKDTDSWRGKKLD